MWESEHYAMAIFEAAALALTHFERSCDTRAVTGGGFSIDQYGLQPPQAARCDVG
jgi:hypothetical protein